MLSYIIPEVPYREPWSMSFEMRVNILRKGEIKVAYFYENPDNSTFRYRVYNMIQALELESSKTGISAAYFTLDDLDRIGRVIDMADVLVICRTRYTNRINQMITKARARGCNVLYDVDDMVFNPNYTHLILNTLDQELHNEAWDFWFAYISRIGAVLQLCNGVIVTNDYLADRVAEYVSLPTYVIPNFINNQQIHISQRIVEARKRSRVENDMIHIGYFSGSPTHNRDFEIVAGPLASLMEKDKRLHLQIAGYLDLKGPIQNYQHRIETHPHADFVNFQRLIGSVDINIVPLQSNTFTNCKSELKYFEAALVKTVTVASPTFTYEHAIQDGYNGYLSHSYEWEEKLFHVISHAKAVAEVNEVAYADVAQKYFPITQSAHIKDVLLSGL